MASAPHDQVVLPETDAPPADAALSTPDKPSPQLPAPPGWQKQIASLKKSGTPKRKDVSFIAPDGEEIHSKRMLDRYLKSHPGGPPASEFDWSTGETPTRRSSRLSSKTRPSLDSPEGESGGKRSRKTEEKEVIRGEEKEEPEDSSAEVPPSAAKKDEAMEYVEKGADIKTVEDNPVPIVEENGDKERALTETQTEEIVEASAAVIETDTLMDEERKPEESHIPTEEKSAGGQCDVSQVESKDTENQLNSQNGEVTFQEEHKEQKESSDVH